MRSRGAISATNGWPMLLVVVLSSVLAGVLVAHGLGWVVVALVALGAVMSSRMEFKIAIGFLLVYYPFSPGSFGPIPNLLSAEVLVPAAFPIVLLAVARAGKPILPKDASRFGIAAGVLLAATAFHFVSGPVLASLGGGRLGSTGLRPFYNLFAYILLFFIVVWVLDWLPKTKEAWTRFLVFLLVASLALALVRVMTVVFNIDTPLMTGVFDYGGRTRLPNGTPVLRIGGLAETATLGLASLAALWTMRVIKPAVAVTTLVLLLACVGLSGGRSLSIGVAVAVIAYLAGPARGRRLRLVLGGAFVAAVVLGLATFYGFTTQVTRILALEGGIAAQDPARAEIFRVLWTSFLENPLIGKGIGTATEGLSDAFVAAQVVAGGHSSYMSMLGNFGLVGVYFLIVFLLDPALRALVRTRRAADLELQSLRQGLMTFVLVHAVIKALEYVAGGSGYRDPSMFAIAGLFVVANEIGIRGRDGETA